MRDIVITLLLFIVSGISFSNQNVNTSKGALTSIQLKEDLTSLQKALEKYHPGLYWYTSREEFNLIWNDLDTSTNTSMTQDQFFKLLLPVIAKIKCAHTLFYPSDSVMSRGTRFPLDLKFISGRAYIMSDHSNQYKIPKGSELLSINGKSLKEIVQSLLPNLQAQGGNVGWKYIILENDFQNYYYYLIDKVDAFAIDYLDYATKKPTSIVVDGISMEILRHHWKNWYPKEDGPPLDLKFLNDNDIAIMTIQSLAALRYKEYNQKFDRTIDRFFEDISLKGSRNLIIDIRGNEGGSESTKKLYSYLINGNAPSTKNKANNSDGLKPNKHNFDGNTIVLTNEKSISALETFVSILKYYGRGSTVGRSTPGCYKGLCGGKRHELTLRHSGFKLAIPMHQTIYTNRNPRNYQEGNGYTPDFVVEEKIEDILEGKDVVMEFALGKIKN